MKKIIVLLVLVFAMSSFNAFATNNETTTSTQSDSNWRTCQFSLSSYTGTISDNSYTRTFKVLLNCPQESDISATVYVHIDGECVASDVVTIKAGKTESEEVCIKVRSVYQDKEYTLTVVG
ncbi:MAG: hypothetical protein E7129_06425 [Rikenellaceae bacterium]|nr:hypothetical protein [Rikenellaceae bacterium]